MLVGGLLIGLFILSDLAKSPTCGFLIIGGVSMALGVFLWFRDPAPPPQPTGRFRIFRNTKKNPEKKNRPDSL